MLFLSEKNEKFAANQAKQLTLYVWHRPLNSVPPKNPTLSDFYQMQEIDLVSA